MGQVLRESLKQGHGSGYFERIMEERGRVAKPLAEATQSGLNSNVSIKSKNTRAGVIGSFRSRLEIWLTPLVDSATLGSGMGPITAYKQISFQGAVRLLCNGTP